MSCVKAFCFVHFEHHLMLLNIPKIMVKGTAGLFNHCVLSFMRRGKRLHTRKVESVALFWVTHLITVVLPHPHTVLFLWYNYFFLKNIFLVANQLSLRSSHLSHNIFLMWLPAFLVTELARRRENCTLLIIFSIYLSCRILHFFHYFL